MSGSEERLSAARAALKAKTDAIGNRPVLTGVESAELKRLAILEERAAERYHRVELARQAIEDALEVASAVEVVATIAATFLRHDLKTRL